MLSQTFTLFDGTEAATQNTAEKTGSATEFDPHSRKLSTFIQMAKSTHPGKETPLVPPGHLHNPDKEVEPVAPTPEEELDSIPDEEEKPFESPPDEPPPPGEGP